MFKVEAFWSNSETSYPLANISRRDFEIISADPETHVLTGSPVYFCGELANPTPPIWPQPSDGWWVKIEKVS